MRKFQKGKRDFFKNFTILSSVLFFCVLHSAIWIPKLQYQSEKSRLSEDIVYSNFFRRQPVSDEVLKKLKESEDPGKFLGLYWLESDFEREKTVGDITKSENRWKKAERWNSYVSVCRAIWNDLEYFPVAETNFGKVNVSFSDSWMLDRTYKGDRKHEGTTGKFPVHLHLGIYIYKDGKEISVNPYAALKYVENRKIKAYSDR